jgi:hypothetical protein
MMKRTATIIALAAAGLVASSASAQTNDHFDRQRREAVARQAAAQHQFSYSRGSNSHIDGSHHGSGHWGGPTTTHRYYRPTHGHIHQQNVQFYPVGPYGYGIPSYGFYGGVSPYNYYSPNYGFPGGSGVYIHREIYHSR